MNKQTITARENFARADVFLSENLQGYTRSSVKKLFQNGLVTANGKPLKPSQEISALTQVEVTLPDAVEYSAKPENIPLDIVYEDADIAVVNKPQGMTVHMGNGNVDGTLVNALLYRLDNLSGINGVIRPGIVHRIDKDTSGLLVVAKNDAAHLSLSLQIEQKTCKRTYLALLEGNLKTDSGTVTTYIGRDPSDRIKNGGGAPRKRQAGNNRLHRVNAVYTGVYALSVRLKNGQNAPDTRARKIPCAPRSRRPCLRA